MTLENFYVSRNNNLRNKNFLSNKDSKWTTNYFKTWKRANSTIRISNIHVTKYKKDLAKNQFGFRDDLSEIGKNNNYQFKINVQPKKMPAYKSNSEIGDCYYN